MSPAVAELLLSLFVVFLAIQQGGGLYESRAIVPQWRHAPPEALEAALVRSGQKAAGWPFWPFVSPPVALLSLADLWAATTLPSPRGAWWLAASLLAAGYSVATYSWFVPTMLRLWKAGTMEPQCVRRLVRRWVGLGPLRHLVGIAALLCALKALAMS